jgi:hypothetical protein
MLDEFMVLVARLMYGGRMDVARLRERAEYMYIPPEQLMTRAIAATLGPSLGLRVVAEYDMPGTSGTELRQRTTVFVKES